MNSTGLIQKNTLSRVSVLQPKSLNFHYFILKVTFFLQCFGRPIITTILLNGQFRHLLYQVRVNNTALLIFKITSVQDSQMILLPQVQTIVTLFLEMTWCVQLLQIIATCANTGKEWLHQTLLTVVFICAARMIRFFFVPLTAVRWLKIMRISGVFPMGYLPHIHL